MLLNGYLSKFSLPEIFEFLEQGYKTGLLTVNALQGESFASLNGSSNTTSKSYYIWFRQGAIIAAAGRLDNQGLISMILRRGWVNENTLRQYFQASDGRMALGVSLKSSGLLTAEQLTILFRTQIMEQVSSILTLQNAKFNFDIQASIPNVEMTGLTMVPLEASIKALRNLKDWSALEAKLPDPSFSIDKKGTSLSISKLKLTTQESRVWECADGKSSINEMAKSLLFPPEEVRRIAFRLIVGNLVKEICTASIPEKSVHEYSKNLIDFNLNSKPTNTSTSTLSNKVQVSATKALENNKLVNAVNHQGYNPQQQEGKVLQVAQKAADKDKDKIDVSQAFIKDLVGFLQTQVNS